MTRVSESDWSWAIVLWCDQIGPGVGHGHNSIPPLGAKPMRPQWGWRGRLGQCGVQSVCLSTNFGSIKIRPVLLFLYPQFPAIDFNMSATAKSTTPTVPSMVEPKDWTKAPTLELQSGSEDDSDVLDTKAKEHRWRKQVRREEKQHREEAERWAREEAEARACEEVECAKAEAERKATHNVPTLSSLTRPPEGENWPSVTGQRTVAQGWIVTM